MSENGEEVRAVAGGFAPGSAKGRSTFPVEDFQGGFFQANSTKRGGLSAWEGGQRKGEQIFDPTWHWSRTGRGSVLT